MKLKGGLLIPHIKMVERTAKDIKLYARLGVLFYIDGYPAQIVGMKPGKDQEDRDVWVMTLNPSDELIKRYNLQPIDGDMIYTQNLPMHLVFQLNADPSMNRWLYLGNYNGKLVGAAKALLGVIQQQKIIELEKEIELEKHKRIAAVEKLQLMEINYPQYFKRNVGSILEELAPIINKIGIEKKEN